MSAKSRWLDVGNRVRAARLRAGLSQTRLGKLACIERRHVNAIERGKTGLGYARALRLARALGVHVMDLLVGQGERIAIQNRATRDAERKVIDHDLQAVLRALRTAEPPSRED